MSTLTVTMIRLEGNDMGSRVRGRPPPTTAPLSIGEGLGGKEVYS